MVLEGFSLALKMPINAFIRDYGGIIRQLFLVSHQSSMIAIALTGEPSPDLIFKGKP